MTARQDAANSAGAARPATLLGLVDAFEERLGVVAARFPLMETKTERRAPAVVDGWLPPKKASDAGTPAEERFPFLIVRPATGVDSPQGADENAIAVVKVIIGTYSDTDDGWRDVAMIIDAIRNDLGAAPTIDGTGFEHIGPLGWEIPEEQTRPQWFAIMTANWQLPRPRRVEALNAGYLEEF
jgi:hypothetical protein